MKRLKRFVMLLVMGLTGLGLASCASVSIHDGKACADLGDLGAHCDYILHKEPSDMDVPTWAKERVGWICTPSENFIDWQADIQKLCSISKRCSKAELEQLNAFFLKIDQIKLERQ